MYLTYYCQFNEISPPKKKQIIFLSKFNRKIKHALATEDNLKLKTIYCLYIYI